MPGGSELRHCTLTLSCPDHHGLLEGSLFCLHLLVSLLWIPKQSPPGDSEPSRLDTKSGASHLVCKQLVLLSKTQTSGIRELVFMKKNHAFSLYSYREKNKCILKVQKLESKNIFFPDYIFKSTIKPPMMIFLKFSNDCLCLISTSPFLISVCALSFCSSGKGTGRDPGCAGPARTW